MKTKAPNPIEIAERLAKFETFPPSPVRDATIAGLKNLLASARQASFITLRDKQAFAAGYDTGTGWWEACQLMYPLFSITDADKPEDNGMYFRSEAADWHEPEQHVYGPFPSDFERLAKILKLIEYKANDRKAGVGSVDKDFARVQERTQQAAA